MKEDFHGHAHICICTCGHACTCTHAHTILRDMKHKPKLYRYTDDMLNYDSLSKSPYYCSQVIKTQFKAEDVLNAAAPAQHAEGRGSIPSTICGLLYIFEVEMQQVCSKRAKLSDS